MNTSRRDFLSKTLAGAATASLLSRSQSASATQATTRMGQSVANLKLPKMDTVRFGFIGVGRRGSTLLRLLLQIEGVAVNAIADSYPSSLQNAAAMVEKTSGHAPKVYGNGDHDYLNLLEQDDIDAVIIATPWRWHTPMALRAMEAGKQVFVEVPAALTVDECWMLVDASEKYQTNCMMMENVCYGRDEMMLLNMVRAGLLGKILHGEAAYIHELRFQMKDIVCGTGSWRTEWHSRLNANLYPTHGLGPIAQYMGINRSDRFDYIASISSQAIGRRLYADRELENTNPHKNIEFKCGDINTSIIKTVNGRTIMLQHDTTSPRPYTRHNLLQGTNGTFAGFPNRIALENDPNAPDGKSDFHHWDHDMAKWYDRYDHQIWKGLLAKPDVANSDGGRDHVGLDFVMLWRMVYCLRNGLSLDQNVYDAAAWSVIVDLSNQSVARRGNSIDFPDFTRGEWRFLQPISVDLV